MEDKEQASSTQTGRGHGVKENQDCVITYSVTVTGAIWSHVLDNTYVISYAIELMLEHTWQDGPEKTKYTILHPITIPFIPRPPVVTNNGTTITEQMITRNIRCILPPLVPILQITTCDVQMGAQMAASLTLQQLRDYKLDVGPQLIAVKIPVGADGGYYKSHVLDNTYVISYAIELMLEHTWQDGPEKTKYTILHPITIPFIPRPPVVTNNTVPKDRVFNVTLGPFLLDVELLVIRSSGIRSRLELTLKDIETIVTVVSFSLSCSFPTKMIDCFTNGTKAALVVKVEFVPSLSPSQLILRDPSCRPLQSDAIDL
ncbi:UNVERIFIED_CONTAM: hypothetical protein FKN15_046270 [Acipenser sinensis]